MELITGTLRRINFAQRYIDVCNRFRDIENGGRFSKADFNEFNISELDQMSYASKDKMFYYDFSFGKGKGRFSFSFKYGYVECFYSFTTHSASERIDGRFNSIAKLVDSDFDSKVKHKFPIATSKEDLSVIVEELLELNREFLAEL